MYDTSLTAIQNIQYMTYSDLPTIDKSRLTGKFKAERVQFMLMPGLPWHQLIYDVSTWNVDVIEGKISIVTKQIAGNTVEYVRCCRVLQEGKACVAIQVYYVGIQSWKTLPAMMARESMTQRPGNPTGAQNREEMDSKECW